jgi:hypothetical protein
MTGQARAQTKPEEPEPTPDGQRPTVYEIRIQGHLGPEWADWFERMTITLEGNGDTVLTGPVVDQSALHGLLKKVRDLGMPLISVTSLERGPSTPADMAQADDSQNE